MYRVLQDPPTRAGPCLVSFKTHLPEQGVLQDPPTRAGCPSRPTYQSRAMFSVLQDPPTRAGCPSRPTCQSRPMYSVLQDPPTRAGLACPGRWVSSAVRDTACPWLSIHRFSGHRHSMTKVYTCRVLVKVDP